MNRGAAIVVAVVAFLAAALPAASSDSRVVLIVTGDVANVNRGPFDAFQDGFLNYHGHNFQRAFAFDTAALDALPQRSLAADAAPWPRAIAMSGPRLADVLAAAGATGKPIVVYALDGYGAAMTPEEVAAHDWVLATHADGKALAIGGRGPLWLVYDTGPVKATAEEEAAWVWSVFHIAAGE